MPGYLLFKGGTLALALMHYCITPTESHRRISSVSFTKTLRDTYTHISSHMVAYSSLPALWPKAVKIYRAPWSVAC